MCGRTLSIFNFVLSSQIMQMRELNETFDRNMKLNMIGAPPEPKEELLVESKKEKENNKKERRTEVKDRKEVDSDEDEICPHCLP